MPRRMIEVGVEGGIPPYFLGPIKRPSTHGLIGRPRSTALGSRDHSPLLPLGVVLGGGAKRLCLASARSSDEPSGSSTIDRPHRAHLNTFTALSKTRRENHSMATRHVR
eukprot:scaffold157099_cov32-Tisochrysis_lutea.AAC.3